MANRYTDSDKWGKAWYCGLTPTYKLFWNYLCDNCNIAGIWSVNWALVKFHIWNEEPMDHKILGDRIEVLSDSKWFIKEFVLFQQKIPSLDCLNPKNKAHLGIIRILEKEGILNRSSKGASKGLQSPPVIGIVIGNVIGNGSINKKTKKITPSPLLDKFLHLKDPSFLNSFQNYLDMRKKIKRPATERAKELALIELQKHPLDVATKMLDQSVFNSWQGIFPLKEQGKFIPKTGTPRKEDPVSREVPDPKQQELVSQLIRGTVEKMKCSS